MKRIKFVVYRRCIFWRRGIKWHSCHRISDRPMQVLYHMLVIFSNVNFILNTQKQLGKH